MAKTYTWTLAAGTAGAGNVAADWSPAGGPPTSGDTGILTNGGTILLPDVNFHSNTLVLGNGLLAYSGDNAITTSNPSLDQSTTITNATGLAAAHGTITDAGSLTSLGSIVLNGSAGGVLSIAISNLVTNSATIAGSFQNDGSILVDAGNSLTITASGAGAGFGDGGTVDVEGGTAVINAPALAPNLINSYVQANYVVGQSGSLEIAQSSSSIYTGVVFAGAGRLKLDNPAGFSGFIQNFAVGDTIDLGVVNIATVVFDGQGDALLLNGSGGTILTTSVSGPTGGQDGALDGYGNSFSGTLAANGGTIAYLAVSQGGGGDAILTAVPFPGPSVWRWLNNASASGQTAADWSVVSGPGNAFNLPSQPGDAVINPGGTILFGDNTTFSNNTLHVGGTTVAAALVLNGDTNHISFSPTLGAPSLDPSSIIDSAVPGNGTAETTQVFANGYMINEGQILADGPAGSHFSLIIAGGTVTNYPNGTAVTSFQPGYFFNASTIEATQGNTLTIAIGANAELFNTGDIISNGGDIIINADTSAFAGGFAPVRGLVTIEGGGTVETNAAYASTVGGTSGLFVFDRQANGNVLKIDNVASFGGRISGLGAGQTIDLGTIGAVASLSYSQATDILNLYNAAGTIVSSLVISTGNFASTPGTTAVALNNGTLNGFVVGSLVSNGTTDTVLTATSSIVTPNAIGLSGSWQASTSWVGLVIPGATDTPFIGQGSNATFTLTTGSTPVTTGGFNIYDPNATVQITSNTTVTPRTASSGVGTLVVTTGNTLTTAATSITEPTGALTIQHGATVLVAGHLTANSVPTSGTLSIATGNNYGNTFSSGTVTIAGALLAQTTQFVSLDMLAFHRSAEVMLILVLGGTGYLYGGLIGALLFSLLQNALSDATPEYWQFWIGLIFVALVVTGRDRVFAWPQALLRRLVR